MCVLGVGGWSTGSTFAFLLFSIIRKLLSSRARLWLPESSLPVGSPRFHLEGAFPFTSCCGQESKNAAGLG